jgi:hypothetical protein
MGPRMVLSCHWTIRRRGFVIERDRGERQRDWETEGGEGERGSESESGRLRVAERESKRGRGGGAEKEDLYQERDHVPKQHIQLLVGDNQVSRAKQLASSYFLQDKQERKEQWFALDFFGN